jgi:hypothetical protein
VWTAEIGLTLLKKGGMVIKNEKNTRGKNICEECTGVMDDLENRL